MKAYSAVVLTGISSRAWEHPADRGALVALRKLRGFDQIAKRLSGFINERAVRMLLLGSAVRVDERQFSRVDRLYREAAAVLDVAELPELFVRADPTINAMAIGLERPVIVVNSALVDLMDDDELRFVLGHELGHVASGHAVYQTLLQMLIALSTTLVAIPFGLLGARAIMAALMEWSRKAELSADRAGLLATQDPRAAQRCHMKTASGGHLHDLDADAFLEQAKEYHANDDLRDLVIRVLMTEGQPHPFAVVRAGELEGWIASGEYADIVDGHYPRRQDDDKARLSEEAAAAARSYSAEFQRIDESLGKVFNDLGEGIGQVRDWVADRLRDLGEPRNRDREGPTGW